MGGIHAKFTDKRAFKSKSKYTTMVQCFPIMAIFYSLENPKIGFFSLDVEGAETLILGTIIWEEVNLRNCL